MTAEAVTPNSNTCPILRAGLRASQKTRSVAYRVALHRQKSKEFDQRLLSESDAGTLGIAIAEHDTN
jgi:hypothetical protein